MSIAKVVAVSHIARESSDITRLAQFYKEIFGFEEMEEKARFGDFKVIWLNLPTASFQLHLIERNPATKLPEGPWSATSAVADPTHLPRGHHIAFSVSNFDSILHKLKRLVNILEQPDPKALVALRLTKMPLTMSSHLTSLIKSSGTKKVIGIGVPVEESAHLGIPIVIWSSEKDIEVFSSSISLPDRKVKQIFFFDPDGNGLEIASEETPQ